MDSTVPREAATMTRSKAESPLTRTSHGTLEEPRDWSDDEINRYLAMRYRSCADIAFTRGERPV